MFTKDSHPMRHASHGTMDPHCIVSDTDRQCSSAEPFGVRGNEIATKFENNWYAPLFQETSNPTPEQVREGKNKYYQDIIDDLKEEGKRNREEEGRTLGM